MDDLIPNKNNKILFGNTIKSDGFSVDFVFYRKKRMNNGSDVELTLEDFNYEEVHNQYHPIFLDPGRKSLFTAVVGIASAKQIRKSSLLDFYGKDTAHHRFQLYQDRQRAPEMLANMLTHGTAKYNKSQRKRKKKKKGKNDKKKDEWLSLRTDEKNTCFFDDLKVVKTPGFKGKDVIRCSKNKKVWQRDANAATNMMTISKAVWMGEGRPEVFKPKKNDDHIYWYFSQANHVILIIVGDAVDISKDDQTCEHALLAFSLDFRQLIVAINKIPSGPKLVTTKLSRRSPSSSRRLVSTQVCSFRPISG
ncbi:hypothetical protein G6F43_007287 [Rhizopus delemar]|nr:hypothetical protein G6F43_007287 [Rhizopus delemar]